MAFQKSHTDKSNVTSPNSYWWITSFEVDAERHVIRYELKGWKDAASASVASVQPLTRAVFKGVIPKEQFGEFVTRAYTEPCIPMIYEHAKLDPFFADAEEV